MKRTLVALAASVALAVPLFAATPAAADPTDHCHWWTEVNVILGTQGNDRLVGTDCFDLIVGLQGNDRLIGRAQMDTLRGGRDNDVLRGVDGYEDQLNGGSGFDRCRGDQYDSFRRCEVVTVVSVPV